LEINCRIMLKKMTKLEKGGSYLTMSKKFFMGFMSVMLFVGIFLPQLAIADTNALQSNNRKVFEGQNVETYVSLGTSDHIVKPGQSFTVDVYVENVADLTGASIDLKYDPTKVTYTGATPGDLLGELTEVDLNQPLPAARGYYYTGVDEQLGELFFLSFLSGTEPAVNNAEHALFTTLNFTAKEGLTNEEFPIMVTDNWDDYDNGTHNAIIQLSDSQEDPQPIPYTLANNLTIKITNGSTSGFVYEQKLYQHNPLADATVVLENNGDVIQTVQSGDDGFFSFTTPLTLDGNYSIEVSKDGYVVQEQPLIVEDINDIAESYVYLIPGSPFRLDLEWQDDFGKVHQLDLHVDVYDSLTNEYIDSIYWLNPGNRSVAPFVELLSDTIGPTGTETAILTQPSTNYKYKVIAVSDTGNFDDANVGLQVYKNGQSIKTFTNNNVDTFGGPWVITNFTFDENGNYVFLDETPEPTDPVINGISSHELTEGSPQFSLFGAGLTSVENIEVALVRNQYTQGALAMQAAGGSRMASAVEELRYPAVIGQVTDDEIEITDVPNLPSGDYHVEILFDGVKQEETFGVLVRPDGVYLEQWYQHNPTIALPKNYEYEPNILLDVHNVTATNPVFKLELRSLENGALVDELDLNAIQSDWDPTYYTIEDTLPLGIADGKYDLQLRIYDSETATEPSNVLYYNKLFVGQPHFQWVDTKLLPIGVSEYRLGIDLLSAKSSDEISIELFKAEDMETPLSINSVTSEYEWNNGAHFTSNIDISKVTALGDYYLIAKVNGVATLPYKLKATTDAFLNWDVDPWRYRAGVNTFFASISGYNLTGKSYTAELVNQLNDEVIATSESVEVVTDESDQKLQLKMKSNEPIAEGDYQLKVYNTDGELLDRDGYPYSAYVWFTTQQEFYPLEALDIMENTPQTIKVYGMNISDIDWTVKITSWFNQPIELGVLKAQVDSLGQEYIEVPVPSLVAGDYDISFERANGPGGSVHFTVKGVPDPKVHYLSNQILKEEGNVSFTINGVDFDVAETIEVNLVEAAGPSGPGGTKYPATIGTITNNTITVTDVPNIPSGDYLVEVIFDGEMDPHRQFAPIRPAGMYIEETFYLWENIVLQKDYSSERDLNFNLYNVPETNPSFKLVLLDSTTNDEVKTIDVNATKDSWDGHYTINAKIPLGVSQGSYKLDLRVYEAGTTTVKGSIAVTDVLVGVLNIEWVQGKVLPVGASKFDLYVLVNNLENPENAIVEIHEKGATNITVKTGTINHTYQMGSGYQLSVTFDLTGLSESGEYYLVVKENNLSTPPFELQVTTDPVVMNGSDPGVFGDGLTNFTTTVPGYNLAGKTYTATLVRNNSSTMETIAAESESVEIGLDHYGRETLQIKMTSENVIPVGYYSLKVYSNGQQIKDFNGYTYGSHIEITDQARINYHEYLFNEDTNGHRIQVNGLNLAKSPWSVKIQDVSGTELNDLGTVEAKVNDLGQEYLDINIPHLAVGKYILVVSNGSYTQEITINIQQGGTNEDPFVHNIAIVGADVVDVPTSSSTYDYDAIVFDQYGHEMQGETVTWSVLEPKTGISVDAITGVVTIDQSTEAGTFTLIATSVSDSTISESKTITVNKTEPPVRPAAPIASMVTDQDTEIHGTGPVGLTVKVLKVGVEIGSGVVASDNSFSISIPKQVAGTVLTLVSVDGDGNESFPTTVKVVEETPSVPAAPIASMVYDTETVVTGTGPVGLTVKVFKDGVQIGIGIVKTDGTFSISIPKQTAGTELTLKSVTASGVESLPATTIVQAAQPTGELPPEFVITSANHNGKISIKLGYQNLHANFIGMQINIAIPQNLGLSNPQFELHANSGLASADILGSSITDGIYSLLIGGDRLVNQPLGVEGEIGTLTFETTSNGDVELDIKNIIFNVLDIENDTVSASNIKLFVEAPSTITIPANHRVYDVNRNGEVDLSDATTILYHINNVQDIRNRKPGIPVNRQTREVLISDITPDMNFYDVNLDGEVNLSDYTAVLFYINNTQDIRTRIPNFDGFKK
jgi:hypothetical protein